MPVNVFTTVSDSALCQKCPALLAYKIHKGFKNAWKIGIKGNGAAYGTIFHNEIARVFFEAASNPSSSLYPEISCCLAGNSNSLEALIRENIFLPFVEAKSKNLDSRQITSMAEGVTVWVDAMSEFFALIPSLAVSPEKIMPSVFIKPEQKLQAVYEYDSDSKLIITGCYDALLFNPDRGEARLFEFKSYMKSDISVPLSQSLIYSWLIRGHTGITPSVEIIYLAENGKEPDVFSSSCVDGMIESGLAELFGSVFEVIYLRKVPDFLRDLNLCRQCPFNETCRYDWRS